MKHRILSLLILLALLFPAARAGDKKAVAAGEGSVFVIKDDGSLWAFGNNWGQLGDGSRQERRTPVKVMTDVVEVSHRGRHTLALRSDGSVWAWGENEYGQLGDSTCEASYVPIKVIDGGMAQVSAGVRHSMAVGRDGSLWLWGYNENGCLTGGKKDVPQCRPKKVMSGIRQAAAGYDHCLAVGIDGTLWSWGTGEYICMGDGSVGKGSSVPVKIMTDVRQADVYYMCAVAVRSDGWLCTWGADVRDPNLFCGGDNVPESKPILRPELVMSGQRCASAGGAHFLSIGKDGALWGWGSNHSGELGLGQMEFARDGQWIEMGVKMVAAGFGCSLWITGNGDLKVVGTLFSVD